MTEAERIESLPDILAKRLCAGISVGNDWPNTDDELLRLQSASELRRLSADLEALKKSAKQMVFEVRKDWPYTTAHRVRVLRASIDLENTIYAIKKEQS